MSTPREDLLPYLQQLAWGAWIELGVPGWGRSHRHWYVDPEALLLLTASAGHDEARLWRESLAWVAGSWPLLSRARLRQLLRTWPWRDGWSRYASELASVTGRTWPQARAGGERLPKGKSGLDLEAPGALGLRLRAFLGVGARSEILRILLLRGPEVAVSARDLAEEAGYTKRNLTEALHWLARSGALDAERRGQTIHYALRYRAQFEEIFGPLPGTPRSFLALTRALVRIAHAFGELAEAPPGVRSSEARQVMAAAEPDLRRAAIPFPRPPAGRDAWASYWAWARHVLEASAAGRHPAETGQA